MIRTQKDGNHPVFNVRIWMFPKIGVPQNGWFVMENPIKMDDLGVSLFLETPIYLSYICRRMFEYGYVSKKIYDPSPTSGNI